MHTYTQSIVLYADVSLDFPRISYYSTKYILIFLLLLHILKRLSKYSKKKKQKMKIHLNSDSHTILVGVGTKKEEAS